jgi:hypothetical protein
MLLALLVVDGAAVVGIEAVVGDPRAAEAAPALAAPATPAPAALDEGWHVCQLEHAGKPVTPVSAAITYLDAGADRALTASQVGAWFGDLERGAIDVWKLETVQGERRVSFELSRARWPRWDQAVGDRTGKDACSAVRGELLAIGVGRPAGAEDAGLDADRVRSRHDLELLYARRSGLYRRIEWAGTLDAVLGEVEFAMVQRWLETGR